jgi:hypothetical protein
MNLEELIESGPFQGLFQATFQEDFTSRFLIRNDCPDLRFSRAARIVLVKEEDGRYSGRFEGEIETSNDHVGEATGTLLVTLPNGLDTGDGTRILESATMKVSIEKAPGLELEQGRRLS